MDGFVNHEQRGVQLPPGCKDLIDVLNCTRQIVPDFREWDSISGWKPLGSQPESIDHGTLEQIKERLTPAPGRMGETEFPGDPGRDLPAPTILRNRSRATWIIFGIPRE